MSTGSAQTIDSLFGPLPTVMTWGRAWLWLSGQKQLKTVPPAPGRHGRQYTELLEGELQPGQELVTGILLGTEATNRAGQTASPLMQQRGGPMGGLRAASAGAGADASAAHFPSGPSRGGPRHPSGPQLTVGRYMPVISVRDLKSRSTWSATSR